MINDLWKTTYEKRRLKNDPLPCHGLSSKVFHVYCVIASPIKNETKVWRRRRTFRFQPTNLPTYVQYVQCILSEWLLPLDWPESSQKQTDRQTHSRTHTHTASHPHAQTDKERHTKHNTMQVNNVDCCVSIAI